MLKKYVVGILTDPDRKRILLIDKKFPSWQKGKLNGVGGKVESFDRTPKDAMIRECFEETGLTVLSWRLFMKLIRKSRNGHVYFFFGISDQLDMAFPYNDVSEIVKVYDISNLPTRIMKNLLWIIPMATDSNNILSYCIDREVIIR